ncbi:MAG: ABC transporter ATP-binding protein [Pirellula sp.]|jgi:ABC-2 type transport system ATP-binding protein|nr:ABC transporter ATP-binding protein [Pirellula sp.]
MAIVSVKNLTKRYGEFLALNGCSLEVPQGSIFGLLGPNGAGKTTLIRSLLGYIKPTSGVATIDGFDCITESLKVRERTSYLPAETKLFRTMRGIDCIEFFSSIHPRGDFQRAKSIAERLQLDWSRRVAFMSTGMRQKLAISCVLSCSTSLIILDEPTANLDPNVRAEILVLVKEAQSKGATIVFCSHVLSEIEEICDRAAILRRGEAVETIDIKSVKPVHRVRGTPTVSMRAWSSHNTVRRFVERGDYVEFELDGDMGDHLELLQTMKLGNIVVESVGLRTLYDRIHTA